MIIDKILKKVAKNCTGSLQIRPGLHNLFFRGNKVIATDSYKLIEVEYLEEQFEKMDINADDIIKNEIELSKLDNNPKARFVDNYDTFFLKEENKKFKVKFSVDYMIELLQVYKAANIKSVLVSFDTPLSPIDIYGDDESFRSKTKIKIKSILMPLKTYESNL